MNEATAIHPCNDNPLVRGPDCQEKAGSNYKRKEDGSLTHYVPCRPSGLRTTSVTANRVDLMWNDKSFNEQEFQISRGLAGETTFFLIGTAAAEAMTFADQTVSASATYRYKVQARVEGVFSFDSNEIEVKVPPIAPSNLTATALSTSEIRLNWEYGPTYEQGFKVERRTESGSFAEIATAPPLSDSHTDTERASGTTYFYRIRAFNQHGDSAYSNEASAKTQGTAGTGPQGPSGLGSGTVSASQVTITWTDNSGNETGFRIERKTGTAAFAQIATVPANVTTYADTSVASFTTYTYRVTAFGEGGNALPSNWATVTTPSAQGAGPSPPCCLQALTGTTNSGGAFVSLTWADLSSDETGFRVERRIAGSSTWSLLGTLPAGSTSFGDTIVSLGWTYQYRVGAVNLLGANYSGEVEVTAGQ